MFLFSSTSFLEVPAIPIFIDSKKKSPLSKRCWQEQAHGVIRKGLFLSLRYEPSTECDFAFDIERPNGVTCLARLFLPTSSIMPNTRAGLSAEMEQGQVAYSWAMWQYKLVLFKLIIQFSSKPLTFSEMISPTNYLQLMQTK